MPFSRSTLQEITNQITSDFQSRIDGAESLLRRSVLRIMARVFAGAFHLMYGYLDYQAKQLFISTADSAGLDSHAAEYGLSRNSATAATGSGSTTGTNGITIPEETELSAPDGRVYTTDIDVTISGGMATLAFTAEIAGEDGNDNGGIVLTFVSPISGVGTSVTVDSDGITGGEDEESDSDLRERILRRKRIPPHGGASFDYITWAKEYDGVTRAWCFPLYSGAGTVGVAFVRDNDDVIVPDATQRAAVRAYIVEHEDPATGETVGCPVTAEPGLEMIPLTLMSVDFNIQLYPNTTAVQEAVEQALADLIEREGGPGETIFLSEIHEAISLAEGEEYHLIVSPVADVSALQTQIHNLGTVTFNDYT